MWFGDQSPNQSLTLAMLWLDLINLSRVRSQVGKAGILVYSQQSYISINLQGKQTIVHSYDLGNSHFSVISTFIDSYRNRYLDATTESPY